MQDYIPDAMKRAPKKTFGAFQTDWLRKYFKAEVFKRLDSSFFRDGIYFDTDKLMAKTEKLFLGQSDNSFFLWQALNLEMWFRRYIKSH